MPRGASPKREREYKELVNEFEGEGRYKGREKEVAARIVNKQRRERGETKAQRGKGGGGGGRSSSSRKSGSSSTASSWSRRRGGAGAGKSTAKRRTSTASSRSGKSFNRSGGSRGGSGGSNRGGSNGRGGRSGRSAVITTDHDHIREWAESRGARPSCVRGTGGRGDTGMIRLDFPGFSGGESLQEISWDDWFDAFDRNNLALLHRENDNFNKLVDRSQAQRGRNGARNEDRGRGQSKRSGNRSSTKSKRGSGSSGRRRSSAAHGR